MIGEQSIIVIDDDDLMRQSVAALAASMRFKSQAYASAEDFLAGYDHLQGSCLVLDVRLRGMSGMELMDAMLREGLRVPTIVVTAFADVPLVVSAMRSGAVAVLEKPYRAQELWEAIREALAIDSRIRRNEARLAQARRQMTSLSPEECRVLDLILAGKTNKGIARELSIGLRTVEGRRHTLMNKLNVGSLAELIQMVIEVRPRRGPSCLSASDSTERHGINSPYPRLRDAN